MSDWADDLEERKIMSPMALRKLFETMRFDEKTHLGLGDIRVTIALQDQILNAYTSMHTALTRIVQTSTDDASVRTARDAIEDKA